MTSFLGILVLALPVVASVVVFFMPDKAESPVGHKRWRTAFIFFAVFYSGLVWFWQYRTDAEAEAKRVEALKQNSESVRKVVKDEDQTMMTGLNATITTLSNLVSSQQKQISDIHDSNIVTGKKPVRVEISNPNSLRGEAPPDIHVSSMPGTQDPKFGKNALQFILTTNKVMNGARVQVSCKNKINNGSVSILGTNYAAGIISRMLDDNTYVGEIGSPNWAPGFPVLITLYFDEDQLGTCEFKPL
jgi:hypothetical protein